MAERLAIGAKVRFKSHIDSYATEADYAGQEGTVQDAENPYYSGDLTYYVKPVDGEAFWAYDRNMEIDEALVQQSTAVMLNQEQAARVREALEVLGWDDDDLGPLAAPPTPKKVIKATITLPDDDQVRYARADFVTAVEGWNGTIEFED